MPELTIYTLHPRGAIHVGRHGIGQEETRQHVPADTLFAALVSAWVDAGGRGEAWCKGFAGSESPFDPPFLLTSAFPYAGGVRFYPLPRSDLALLGVKVEDRRKDLNRIAFVSENIFRRIVAGESLAGYLPPREGDPEEGLFLQGQELWLTTEEIDQLPEAFRIIKDPKRHQHPRLPRAFRHLHVWKIDKVPRVTVNRISSAGEIFHTGRVTFAPGCGLWFGVVWRTPKARLADRNQEQTWREAFEGTLSLLADSGLGGERTAGYGVFDWETSDSVTWPDPSPGTPYVTLSRYHPRRAETPTAFQGPPLAYDLTAIAGYLQTPTGPAQRRRRLWLAAEGSVLRAVGDGPYGNLTDVRPMVGDFPHPVWRYGLACPVAIEEVQNG